MINDLGSCFIEAYMYKAIHFHVGEALQNIDHPGSGAVGNGSLLVC